MNMNIWLTTAQSLLTTAEFAQMRDVPYHEAVGSLMYAALETHPDIAFTIQTTISCFLIKSGLIHWKAMKWIFRYLKGTMELWLTYGISKMDLTEAWPKIGMLFWGMPFWFTAVLFRGALNNKRLSLCWQLKLNMLLSPTAQKKPSGFVPSSSSFLTLFLTQQLCFWTISLPFSWVWDI